MLQVGRHAHLGDRDEHAVELRPGLAAREDVGQRMAHQLADAELALRGAGSGSGEARHCFLILHSVSPPAQRETGVAEGDG